MYSINYILSGSYNIILSKILKNPRILNSMNNHFADIGKRLAQYLTTKGITQSKLARLTSTSASQVFNMLNGTKYGVDKLLAVFEALPGLNPEWLLFGRGAMEKIQPEEKLALAQTSASPDEANTNGVTEKLQELLNICRAEKEGLVRIIELKDEMIDMLKKA